MKRSNHINFFDDFRMVIDGRREGVAAASDVINPATEALVGRVPDCSGAQMDAAVAAARSAFLDWRNSPHAERCAIADRMESLVEPLGLLLTRGQGNRVQYQRVKDLIAGSRAAGLRFISERGDFDDVTRRANDSEYGLAASVWGKDAQQTSDVAARLESGTVWIDTERVLSPSIPCGGRKQSGIGVENGNEALLEYSIVKTVVH